MDSNATDNDNGIAVQLSEINSNEETENPLLGNQSDDEKVDSSSIDSTSFREKNPFLLITVAHSGFGLYFAYDGIGALAPDLKKEFNIGSTEIGLLYSAYSIAVTCLAILGGIMVSKIGEKKLLAICTFTNSMGTLIMVMAPNFQILFLGQLLFGIGSSTLYLSMITTIGTWFQDGPSKNFKMTVTLGATHFWLRCASFASYIVLPPIVASANLRVALFFSFLMCALSFVSTLLFMLGDYIDMKRKNIQIVKKKETKSFEFSRHNFQMAVRKIIASIKELPASYWSLLVIAICIVSTLYTFTSFGTTVLHETRNFSEEKSARVTSAVSLTNALSNPLVSLVVGWTAQRTWWAIAGTTLMTLVYTLFGFTTLEPIALMILLGLGQSIMDSVTFPSISIVVPSETLGFASGLTITLYNIALFLLPLIVGVLRDNGNEKGASAVFVVCGAVSIVTACILKYVHRTYESGSLDVKSKK